MLGHWFDKYTPTSVVISAPLTNTSGRDHDVHGPAGPTGFYKVSDQIKTRAPISETEGSPVWEVEVDDDVDDVVEVQAFMGQLAQAIGMNVLGVHGVHVHAGNANGTNGDGDGSGNGIAGASTGGVGSGVTVGSEPTAQADEERGYAVDGTGFTFD